MLNGFSLKKGYFESLINEYDENKCRFWLTILSPCAIVDLDSNSEPLYL